jgi:Subtilase family
MSAWAAKIDELSHSVGVLFIQAAGNILGTDSRHNSPGIHQYLISGRPYPGYLEEAASRIASPAQSLQALTVGSVAGRTWRDESRRSIAPFENSPSAFSRSGLGLWDSIKPEVVEVGGDYARANNGDAPPTIEEEIAVDLIRATGDGGPAIARDDVGTSYAAPKVSHLAALLQNLFPEAHPLLYRGLIVHSARWPTWLDSEGWSADRALRLMGFGIPTVERATHNEAHRVTLVTPNAVPIRNSELHLYLVTVPDELRNHFGDTIFRIDVTLSYSSAPRRTRASRRGYLATWLDWRSANLGEPLESFWARMVAGQEKASRRYPGLDWCLHHTSQYGDARETHRGNGTIQKDWARLPGHELPEQFGIAVRAHKGWDHRDNAGGANYCLIVSIEAESVSVPVYSSILAVNVEVEATVELPTATRL